MGCACADDQHFKGKFLENDQKDLSENTESNNLLFLSTPSFLNERNEQNEQNSIYKFENQNEKKIFEVFHKKEILYDDQNTSENNKDSINIQYKCIYCQNLFNNINKFESHMRKHVSFYKYKI